MRGSHTDDINPQDMFLLLVLAGIQVVPIQFATGSNCGVYVSHGPVDLILQLAGAQTFEIKPRPVPNRPPLEVMLLVPLVEAFAVIEPARCLGLRTPRGAATSIKSKMSSVNVRF